MDKSWKLLAVCCLLGLIVIAPFNLTSVNAQTHNYLHTEGSKIVDSTGRQVTLAGINWFGLETSTYAPHGLWSRSWESLLDQIKEFGFNTIRLPYSNQLFDPGSKPNGINYEINPDLEGLNGLEIMDKIIAGAEERGLKVILDRHRANSQAQSELWYTTKYSEERWISDWMMLVQRYANTDTVIGVDLHNEPHGSATWGTGDPATDWRLAAERAGNAILDVNPNLLIVVQGVDQYDGNWYWWGGNLMGVREYPVRLAVPNRLVYSTHVYGPGVYPQPWFWDPAFPDNLSSIWQMHWGYLSTENIAPVVVGEFGGRSVNEDKEGVWQQTLVNYMRENQLSYFYWTLNPNSGDTGGLLLDDWQSVDADKLSLLSSHQFPLLGIEEYSQEPGAVQIHSDTTIPQLLRVSYRTSSLANSIKDSKPEFIIFNNGPTPLPLSSVEIRYWFTDQSNQPLVFHCDWTAFDCANLTGEFLSTAEGNQYLSLRITSGSPLIPPGENSGEIKVRFNREDWTEFVQADDYSFGPVADHIEWERVTLYVDGELVWGFEPGRFPSGILTESVEILPSEEELVSEDEIESEADPALAESFDTSPKTVSGWEFVGFLGLAVISVLAVGFGIGGLVSKLLNRLNPS